MDNTRGGSAPLHNGSPVPQIPDDVYPDGQTSEAMLQHGSESDSPDDSEDEPPGLAQVSGSSDDDWSDEDDADDSLEVHSEPEPSPEESEDDSDEFLPPLEPIGSYSNPSATPQQPSAPSLPQPQVHFVGAGRAMFEAALDFAQNITQESTQPSPPITLEAQTQNLKAILEGMYGLTDSLVVRYAKVSELAVETEEDRDRSGACSICWEKLLGNDVSQAESTTALPCLHVFHLECALTWMGRNRSCPECRFALFTETIFNSTQGYQLSDSPTSEARDLAGQPDQPVDLIEDAIPDGSQDRDLSGEGTQESDLDQGGNRVPSPEPAPPPRRGLDDIRLNNIRNLLFSIVSDNPALQAQVQDLIGRINRLAASPSTGRYLRLLNVPDEATMIRERRAHLEKFEEMLIKREVEAGLRCGRGCNATIDEGCRCEVV